MSSLTSIVASVAVTLLAYRASRRVHERYPSPLTNPIFLAVTAVMILLVASHADYASYRLGAEPLVALLGPATSALAVPLYKHRKIVAAHFLPTLAGLACGAIATLCAAVALGVGFGLTPILVRSIAIKSVTAPIAVELAVLTGGDPAVTVAMVVATGMLGAMLGSWMLDRANVRDPIARGLAFGTVATGIGTAQAAMEGEVQGAVAGVAMGTAAIAVSIVAPLLVPRLLQLLV